MRRVDFGGVALVTEGGLRLDAIARGRLMGERKSLGNAVVVGDRVTLEWEGDRAMISAVAPRRSAFSRRASGERDAEQVVAANLDQVAIVAALRRPEFRHGLVDRVLAQAHVCGVPAILVLSKLDLGDAPEAAALAADYAPAGVRTLATCAATGEGVGELREACIGRRTLFVGHSGVGKSTLLERLAPGHELLAGEVNERTGKGRHTTTAALLLQPEPGLELIDTPGVRAFALWGIDADSLERHYAEFGPFLGACRFGDCRHDREPGCALQTALERGEIPARRWESFLRLRDELSGGPGARGERTSARS
ncbi:MAG TPA: ribosome small subunit-dependent GTPase A [Candidatus Acidoferrales bacterium]|nr:ribosome small subunit-dependent GTPase A [Candidatus Acidoferrales bacterium]